MIDVQKTQLFVFKAWNSIDAMNSMHPHYYCYHCTNIASVDAESDLMLMEQLDTVCLSVISIHTSHHIDWMTGGHGGCERWTTNCLSAAEYIRKTMRKCTKLNVRSAIEHHFIHIFYSIEIYWWFSARNFRSALCIGTKFDAAHSKPFQSTGICLFCVCT